MTVTVNGRAGVMLVEAGVTVTVGVALPTMTAGEMPVEAL
jgi:hypothetical protein